MVQRNETVRRGFTEILPRASEHDGAERASGGSNGKRDGAFDDAPATAATERKHSVESERETAGEDKAWELEADEGEVLREL